MKLKIVLLLLLSSGMTGCALYDVKRSTPGGDHEGIPFYVKTAGCKREIVRVKPYVLLTLTTKTGDKTAEAESVPICKSRATSAEFEALLEIARNNGDIRSAWANMRKSACDLEAVPDTAADWYVTSDTISPYTYVDYDIPYTLNVKRPLMGSVSATTKVNADGTLSEGTAQVQDTTGETLINAIPSTLSALNPAAAAAAATTPPAEGFRAERPPAFPPYELKIERKGVKFTWTYHDPATHGACERDAALISDPPTAGKPDLVIEDAAAAKKTPDDSNTVKVNGTVQLPKAKDATTPKQ